MNLVEKAAPQRPTDPIPPAAGEQRVVLDGVDWSTYETLLKTSSRSGVFFSYDRGRLEIMSPSRRHERYAFDLGSLVVILAEEMGVPIEPGHSTTLKRDDLVRGIEPDQCFWIEHEEQMRTRRDLDLKIDPPPDLFIEVEISHSLVDRLSICAALGIPEVWRYDGHMLHVLQLDEQRHYRQATGSRWFPGIEPAGLVPFLESSAEKGYLNHLRAFRAWVRLQLSGR